MHCASPPPSPLPPPPIFRTKQAYCAPSQPSPLPPIRPPPPPFIQDKASVLRSISDGSARLLVGTHSLLNVPHFGALGLVIIDEQHKWVLEGGKGGGGLRGR